MTKAAELLVLIMLALGRPTKTRRRTRKGGRKGREGRKTRCKRRVADIGYLSLPPSLPPSLTLDIHQIPCHEQSPSSPGARLPSLPPSLPPFLLLLRGRAVRMKVEMGEVGVLGMELVRRREEAGQGGRAGKRAAPVGGGGGEGEEGVGGGGAQDEEEDGEQAVFVCGGFREEGGREGEGEVVSNQAGRSKVQAHVASEVTSSLPPFLPPSLLHSSLPWTPPKHRPFPFFLPPPHPLPLSLPSLPPFPRITCHCLI
jgi:hypothetical protein